MSERPAYANDTDALSWCRVAGSTLLFVFGSICVVIGVLDAADFVFDHIGGHWATNAKANLYAQLLLSAIIIDPILISLGACLAILARRIRARRKLATTTALATILSVLLCLDIPIILLNRFWT